MPKKEKVKMGELLSRSFEYKVNTEKEENENRGILEGTPIVFNQKADIGGWFEETILPGAVDERILKDVAFFFNHDLNGKRLASTRNKTLEFNIDERGVHMRTELNLERSDSKDLYLAIKDGEITEMSFMFRVEDEEWIGLESDYPTRIIKKIGYVQEVSAVNYPAYSGTEIYARANTSLDNDKKALDNARAEVVDATKEQIKKDIDLRKRKFKFKNNL